jgi:hypothetical protein
MPNAAHEFTPEQRARLTEIWEQLYELYLKQANGDPRGAQIDADIEALIAERNAIRPWGWNTGRNWKDDLPPEEIQRLMQEKYRGPKE